MEIPKKIKIGGRNYNVLFPYNFMERGDIKGQHDGDMEVLRIDSRDIYSHELRPMSSVVVTLIHEVLHAIDYVTGHRVFSENEKACEGFSECLYQILVDNGWLELEQ
uniref:WLM domain-containing protein n=1 Tax=viral metagenome TaxID=1070528 RepID=A0A6M3ILT9_9ZZZZ